MSKGQDIRHERGGEPAGRTHPIAFALVGQQQ